MARMLNADSNIAAYTGYRILNCARYPDIAGPIRKPRPNAIPITANDLVRSSGFVTSAM